MVAAGDGAPRSETRQKQLLIAFRVTAAERQSIAENAERAGFQSRSAFVLMRSLERSVPGQRKLEQTLGRCGLILEHLRRLRRQSQIETDPELTQAIDDIARDVAQMLKDLSEVLE